MTSTTSLTRRSFALGGTALLVTACGGGSSTPADTADPTSYGGGQVPGSVQMTITHRVTMTTSMGVINIGLDANHAPLSTNNFLAYVKSGAYVNTVFHRVIEGFVVQGGGFTDANGTSAAITANPAIGLESRNGLSNTFGTLGVARTTDPNSGTSQFYINVANNAAGLDYPASDGAGYAVFGTVMDTPSMEIVIAISQVPVTTHADGSPDWPVTDVTITAIALAS